MKTKPLALLTLALLPSFFTPANADLKDGLVAHWSFDDCRATDNSGNGHDGTLGGNPQCVDGVKGKAFSFDGVSDFIKVPNFEDNSQNIAVSAWIYTKDITTNRYYEIARSHTFLFSFQEYGEQLTFGINEDMPLETDTSIVSSSITNGQWHHLIGTKNGNDFSVFIDGVLAGTKNLKQEKITGIYDLFIGSVGGVWEFFNGSIDDLRIYNRALTEAEVMELYNGKTELTYTPEPDPTPIIGTMPDPKLEASGVCSVTQTAAMQVGGTGMISSSSAAEVYDFGGNSSTTKTCTNVGLPTDKPTDPFYEFVNYVYDKKIDDAVAIIPTLLGYLVEKSPDSLKKHLIKISGDSFVTNRLLTAQIKQSLIEWQTLDLKNMGIDFVADKATEWMSQYVSTQIGGSNGRYVGGAVWFSMKQSWAVYKAQGEAGGVYSPLFPLALLKAQSDLLMGVIKKDIEEFGILQTSLVSAIEAKMRSEMIKGEATLIDDERAYFRAETVSEKNKIRTRMIAKQKAFLKPHLTGKKEFISKNKATEMFNVWKSEFPGQLVKEEFGTRAKLSALISAGKLDEAKTLAEAFFGRSVDVFSDQIVIKDDILTNF